MSKPADPTDPVETDPNTWQCCQCDSRLMEAKVEVMVWDGKETISCELCGHPMSWECCGPDRPSL